MTGRGTADNVFVLQTAIHLRLQRRKGKLYTIFVDFKRAFDSVPHAKLWTHLNDLGISSKILRILISFYSQASLRVRTGTGLSDSADVSEGVLQGEILSSLPVRHR